MTRDENFRAISTLLLPPITQFYASSPSSLIKHHSNQSSVDPSSVDGVLMVIVLGRAVRVRAFGERYFTLTVPL